MSLSEQCHSVRVLPPLKPPRIIVEHFDIGTYKVDKARGYVEANCQHCGATIRGQRNVTSNFIQHMRRRHPDAYDRFAASSTQRAKRPRLTPSKSPTTPPAPVISSALPPPTPQQHVFEMPRPTPRPRSAVEEREQPEPLNSELTLETALVCASYRAAKRTSCIFAHELSQKTGCRIDIKREDEQVSGSAIFRAAYNYLAATPTSRGGLVAAASSSLPVAIAAQMHSKPCTVVLPVSSPPVLLRKIASCDSKYELGGCTEEESIALAMSKATEMNRTYVNLTQKVLVSGYSVAAAGYATLALELLQQRQHVDRIFMSGGNAPLFAGVSAVLGRVGRGVKLIGVVTDSAEEDSETNENDGLDGMDMQKSWKAFAEAVVSVSEAELCAAVKAVFDDCNGCLLAPDGVLSVAGAVKYAQIHKVAHERIVCVVDSPLKQFDSLKWITENSWRADGSQCLLVLQRRDDTSLGVGGDILGLLMRELSGTARLRLRVTSLKFSGKWPLVLGLECDSTTTAAAHVANLTSLGYDAMDITGTKQGGNEMWMWEDPVQGGDTELTEGSKWALFQVEIVEAVIAVVNFLAIQRTDPPLARVSFTHDGSGTARLLVAARGSDVQLSNLEKEMLRSSKLVERLSKPVFGPLPSGCPAAHAPESSGPAPEESVVGRETTENATGANFALLHDGRAHEEPQQQRVAHHDVPQSTVNHSEPDPSHLHHHTDLDHVNTTAEHSTEHPNEHTTEHTTHHEQEPHAQAEPHHSSVDQDSIHRQHEALHHEDLPPETLQSADQEDIQTHATQSEAVVHDAAQVIDVPSNVEQPGIVKHEKGSQDETNVETQVEQHPAHADQPSGGQGCEAADDNARDETGQGEGAMVVSEAGNAGSELAMSFADGEADAAVQAADGEMDLRGNELPQQQVSQRTERGGEEPQLQNDAHFVEHNEAEADQQADVEMQDDEPIDDLPVHMEQNPESHMEGHDEMPQEAKHHDVRPEDGGVTDMSVEGGEVEMETVAEGAIASAAATANAAGEAQNAQMNEED